MELKTTVCRTCMSSENLRPLFKDSENNVFLRALRLTTGLQIKSDDHFPQHICKSCVEIIELAMDFRLKSQATERKLLNLINKKNELSTHTIEREESEQLEEITVNEIIKKCDEIEKVIHYDDSDSIETGANDSKEIVQTNQRNSDAKSYLELIEGPVVPKGLVTCKLCHKKSKSMNAFRKHIKSHLGYEILCEFCARRCISHMQLLRHQRAKHGLARDDSFVCSYCQFQAIDREQLESHERRTHTKERPYVCAECGEAFYTKRVLMQHGYSHKTEKPFQCDLCPSKFKLRARLTSHKNFVHNKKFKYMYGCYLCPKTYMKSFEAKKHILKIHAIPKEEQHKIPRYNIEDMGNKII